MLRRISSAYVGGALGALVDSINIWLLGVLGITPLLGVGLQPELTAPWIYQRMFWGGIWGFLFMIPLLRRKLIARGVLFSLGPSALMLFVVFPNMGKGILGLSFGALTPVVVIVLNFIWGIVASYWYDRSSK